MDLPDDWFTGITTVSQIPNSVNAPQPTPPPGIDPEEWAEVINQQTAINAAAGGSQPQKNMYWPIMLFIAIAGIYFVR